MILTKQRAAELFMLVAATVDIHRSIEDPNRTDEQWKYEELMFKTLVAALDETYTGTEASNKFTVMWTAPRCDRPYVMDWLESYGEDLDPILNAEEHSGRPD